LVDPFRRELKLCLRDSSDNYGLRIDCDDSLSDVKVFGKLDLHDSIDKVLESIGNIVPMEIEREGSLITMRTKV
ncbi:MAG: DUF4974 domain-containing protein, partial [Muribaculaceae bacterium]|nr:DUF4974 domain-containing protein [Muribaculaceae bacterium]